ncbi:hypothetical protein QUG64_08860 [Acinetobacter lwoffii]|uniref:DUF4175 domain-containing protein n=1 Tax=Acinetobacter lwoffii NCTC 5866 = CIP 64.10 = NIPH 512 TaxID=981327 RepID=A0ABP2ZAN1_ACILW|nr:MULTISPECIES: hypothetical protein [Acinetobacter]ENU15382.1 hypothetical protein F995_02546 [Acinetobacter sp. CIP A162]ESJ94416.1 hypothetical protein P800_02499 [Acinetobacter lwoffii NCTC 5866 = CIP 64.10 = NIPH 512]QXB41661.1 hypothetical protein I6L23_06480 [Acinetobacter lwoffii]QXB86822.1 hypothetical protein I6L24_04295 [Acinetobacter lwoffii]QZM12202.1 hypothetical protein ABVS_1530 [Acinetobacter lwoffii]
MNAPRQGLFASLLIVSFALHTFLLVLATTHQLNENRANQGQLITSQLVTDSLSELEPPNRVSLALLANRYATNPSVASIRILDAKAQVLATGGLTKTREGEVFVRDALQNEKKVGVIEITLIEPSIGEILRTQWLAILFSFIIHALIWVAYRAIARPSRTEYLARINNESRLKFEIQTLTQALEQEKHNAALAIAQAQQAVKNKAKEKEHKPAVLESDSLSLNIQFYDPKQLLDSVNKTVSVPYFNLCQIFLNKATELCVQRYKLNSSDICTVHKFDEKGATISIAADKPNALACLTMISAVFQLLSEVLYKRYREEKRFVLQTRSAIASKVEEMQLSSVQAAERLTQHLVAKESALHVPNTLLKDVSDHFQLVSMPNPTNVLTRHAFVVNGMDAESAELAQTFRTEILKSKQSKAS